MNIRQAAKQLGISHTSVRRRIAAGKLQAHRDGKRVIIWPQDIVIYRLRWQRPVAAQQPPSPYAEVLQQEFPNGF